MSGCPETANVVTKRGRGRLVDKLYPPYLCGCLTVSAVPFLCPGLGDLPAGGSGARALRRVDRAPVRADLIAYAQALGSLHVWSMGRAGELADLRGRYVPGAQAGTRWLDAIQQGKDLFLAAAATLGLAIGGVREEIDQLARDIGGNELPRLGARRRMPGQCAPR